MLQGIQKIEKKRGDKDFFRLKLGVAKTFLQNLEIQDIIKTTFQRSKSILMLVLKEIKIFVSYKPVFIKKQGVYLAKIGGSDI